MLKTLIILCFASLIVLSSANDPFLGYKGETGFIPVTSMKDELFYWFFPSQRDPANDPLVVWLTGGPGCSSELAIFMENGPFKIDPKNLKLSLNEYSWNKGANLIYVDQPIGTGYSNPVRSSYDQNEDQVSLHLYNFLVNWLEKHPSYKGRPLFLLGESYAGHYIPAISAYIARHKTPEINFIGFGIGNGLVDVYYQYPSYATFALDNGLTNLTTIQKARKMLAQCQTDIRVRDHERAWIDCQGGMREILGNDGPQFNVYDIRKPCAHPPLCYDTSYIDNFLAQPEIIDALGVRGREWSECNTEVHMALEDDMFTSLRDDMSYLLENGYTALLYYGDSDFICNWYGGLEMANNINWSRKNEFNVAGFKPWKNYGEYKQVGPLTFLRVFGAGHLVPLDNPAGALDILETFLKGWAIQTSEVSI